MADPTSTTRLLAVATIGYLAGTLPSADLASKLARRGDIREMGTGNPGAANAIAQLGAGWGYAVLAADVGKAAAASVAGRVVAGDIGGHVAASAAVAGHCYPVWNGFRGGKGVAASIGQCLVTFPAYFVPDLALAGLIGAMPWWKQRAQAAALVSAGAWTAAATVWWRRGWSNLWGPAPSPILPLAASATSAMILHRFRSSAPAVGSGDSSA